MKSKINGSEMQQAAGPHALRLLADDCPYYVVKYRSCLKSQIGQHLKFETIPKYAKVLKNIAARLTCTPKH